MTQAKPTEELKNRLLAGEHKTGGEVIANSMRLSFLEGHTVLEFCDVDAAGKSTPLVYMILPALVHGDTVEIQGVKIIQSIMLV